MPNHAIIIGINHYPGISLLDGPCNDARAFQTWVSRPGPGDVAPDNVHILLSTDFPRVVNIEDAKPVSDEIAQLFEEITVNSPTQHVGDRLYVFAAGHGLSDIDHPDSVGLIAANAKRSGITLPHVVITDYVHYFRRNYIFKEIILLMDCCRDANVMRPLNFTGMLRGNPNPNANTVRLFRGYATVWSKQAYEKRFNGITRGIFSKAFMEALEKAPAVNDEVTGQAVKNYIDQNFRGIAGEANIEDPRINGDGHEKIVFYRRTDAQAHDAARAFTITVKIDSAVGGEVVDLFEGPSTLRESKTATSDSVEFKVGAGFYKVSIRDTDRQALIEVARDHEKRL